MTKTSLLAFSHGTFSRAELVGEGLSLPSVWLADLIVGVHSQIVRVQASGLHPFSRWRGYFRVFAPLAAPP